MADECLPKTIEDREYRKFTCNDQDEIAVRTVTKGEFQFSGLSIAGRITTVTINDSSWTALPAAPLANRNGISVQNVSGLEIKLQYDPLTVGYVGVIVPGPGERFYDITDTILIYAKSSSGDVDLTIEELS